MALGVEAFHKALTVNTVSEPDDLVHLNHTRAAR